MKVMLNSAYMAHTRGFFVFKAFTWPASTNLVVCYPHYVLGLQLNSVIVSSGTLQEILEKYV